MRSFLKVEFVRGVRDRHGANAEVIQEEDRSVWHDELVVRAGRIADDFMTLALELLMDPSAGYFDELHLGSPSKKRLSPLAMRAAVSGVTPPSICSNAHCQLYDV